VLSTSSLRPDGKTIAVGQTYSSRHQLTDIALARYSLRATLKRGDGGP